MPDFRTACALREHATSVTILLCGTSGTGKSTLASLLASRLGITTVVSTDRRGLLERLRVLTAGACEMAAPWTHGPAGR